MKKTSTLIKNGIVLSLLTSTLLHATNGDNLISVGTKARGMGGVGIALSHGAESTLNNPALITSIEGTEISFGGTVFMPEIKTDISLIPNDAGTPFDQPNLVSAADTNIIPEVSIAHKINESWYIGAGMFGTAGMGTDYRDSMDLATGNLGNFNMVTNLQLLQFAVPLAYKTSGFSIAVAPILQYGNLDINYDATPMGGSVVGAGLAQDFGFGWSIGASYDFSQNGVEGLTIGAVYKSAINMTYDGQLTTATAPFGLTLPEGDSLEQPAEFGVGFAYTMGTHTIAFDYKQIQWSSAAGYGDFGWEDQDIFAFGYQYSQDNWALRAGYNYASSAVVEVADPRLNFFNLLGFPATAEQHFTVGGTYALTQAFALDFAYVYSPDTTETFDISGLGMNTISTSHQEDSLSFQLTYSF